jgi:GntR family transcriptional regulator/MocR family aminotransferase
VQSAARASGPIRHKPPCAIDFICGLCEPDEGLLRQFKRALLRPLRNRAFSYGDPAGDPALRREIATRLRSTRGISRSPEQIVLTSGTQQALDICARVLLGDGIRAVMEDPGYDVADAIFRAAGSTIVSARVDRDGLDPACLPTDRARGGLVYVTPSHQFPTGAVMPAARRFALLDWARRARAYVFEDDYDGEFRYEGQPIPALAGLDPDVVIYCGTFAKSLFPSCRLGYLALPQPLVRPVVECKWLADRGSSRLVEGAIGELLATGHYDRHIRRMQRRYRARCAALERSLRTHLGDAVDVQGSSAGLHLVAWLPSLSRARVSDLVARSLARGVGVYPVDRYSSRSLPAGLLLGYGLVEIDDVDRGVRGLAAAYREVVGA